MQITISFEANNAAFIDYPGGDGNFDEEIKYVLKQAEDYLTNRSDSEILKDSNGNKIGTVFRSTIRP
jgi:hypothetical protein